MTNAGNLTPPDGAVTPTMSSLEEIEGKLDLIVGSATVVPRYAEVVTAGGGQALFPIVLSGDGVLNAVIPSGNGQVIMEDGTGKSMFAALLNQSAGGSPQWIPLNVRYTDGLQYFGAGTNVTVLYTPDVPLGN